MWTKLSDFQNSWREFFLYLSLIYILFKSLIAVYYAEYIWLKEWKKGFFLYMRHHIKNCLIFYFFFVSLLLHFIYLKGTRYWWNLKVVSNGFFLAKIYVGWLFYATIKYLHTWIIKSKRGNKKWNLKIVVKILFRVENSKPFS